MAYTPYTPLYQPLYYQQPIQQPIQQPQQSGMIWVRNAQEAAMYPVAPNNAVALWDSSESSIYLKQADASGRPTMRTYDLVERKNEPPKDGVDYATKSELAALAGVVKETGGLIDSLRGEIDALKARGEE